MMVLGHSRKHAGVLGLAAVAAAALLAGSASASGTYDLRGVWDTYGTGGGYSGTFTISTMDLATGAFSGTGDGTQFVLKGVETGAKVAYTQSAGSYVSHDDATVVRRNGQLELVGGTFHDTNGTRGTFTATLKAPGPTPVLAQSVAAGTVSGTVLVERPGATAFTPLTAATAIPVGSTVDATHGRVSLTSAAATAGQTHTGVFYDGAFVVRQARSGVTSLTLSGGTPCAATAAKAPGGAPRKRSLWGSAHGGFQTTGRYAAATEIGTRWLTADECTGTLIKVASGAVRVTDLVRQRTFVLRAGHHYLAKA
jgi:hypothetical protein